MFSASMPVATHMLLHWYNLRQMLLRPECRVKLSLPTVALSCHQCIALSTTPRVGKHIIMFVDSVSKTYNVLTWMYIQCVWLVLSRKFSSSLAGRKLRIWHQASRAGGGVFTEVNWLKLLWCWVTMQMEPNLIGKENWFGVNYFIIYFL